MSKATKRKHVTREVLEGDIKLSDGQSIVKIVCGRGNNLHEVESATGERFLVSMPSKFRRNVWIKRGDYVVVEQIAEGHKVQAEIVHILYPEQIKELKQQCLWPDKFQDHDGTVGAGGGAEGGAEGSLHPPDSDDLSGSESESDSDLFVNTNRPTLETLCDDSYSSDST